MEQRTLQNVNNCLNTNIYSYLETSGKSRDRFPLNVGGFLLPACWLYPQMPDMENGHVDLSRPHLVVKVIIHI